MPDIRRGVVHTGAETVLFPSQALNLLVQQCVNPRSSRLIQRNIDMGGQTVGVGYIITISSLICSQVSGFSTANSSNWLS